MDADFEASLSRARGEFRRELARAGGTPSGADAGRIALALSGGGALGAYQAGALLALQDARLPTPIITATSIGGINAASYAAHSTTDVGNAEPLVEAWLGLTSPAVGIDWTRYALMLAGLVAAVAGLGGLVVVELARAGFSLHLHYPLATWLTLGAAGTAVLLFYDYLPYVYRVVAASRLSRQWQYSPRRLALSGLANALVLAFLVAMFDPLHLHARMPGLLRRYPGLSVAAVVALLLLVAARRPLRLWAGRAAQRLLRLPLRSGLFSNFERARLLANHVHEEALRASPIRLLVAVTDLGAGVARYFSNTPPERLAQDPNADPEFVASAVRLSDDPLSAILASSAVPMIYEPVVIDGRSCADGAIAAARPLRPAVRLGADVIFAINPDPLAGLRTGGNTFVDVGLQALAWMMSSALVLDTEALERVNSWCERAAAPHGLAVEQVVLEFGGRRLRHVELFLVQPANPLPGAVLDFGGARTGEVLLRGYLDSCAQILAYCGYARRARLGQPREVLAASFAGIRAAES